MRQIGDRIGRTRLAVIAVLVTLTALSPWEATSASAVQGVYSHAGSLLGDPLVVQSGDLLFADQRQAAVVAEKTNPAAVFSREISRTRYANLGAAGAGRLLSKSFPAIVGEPAGGAPPLPAGARALAYRTSRALEIALPGHRLGILESSADIAKRGRDGRYRATNLNLVRAGNGFTPANSDLPVKIPVSLSSGVALPGTGVSVTPVDAGGRPLRGAALNERASVVYANTERATDTLIKPTPAGFQVDAALRAQDSPQQLYFALSVPRADRLTRDGATGAVQVTSARRKIATILPPTAEDAAETDVPASMRLMGHTLVVTVEHRAGSYLYPIEVDPEINDNQLATTSAGKASNWEFYTSNSGRFAGKAVYESAGKEHLETKGTAEYAATEWAYWGYETKGNSKIYELKAKTSAKNKGAKIESFFEIEGPGGSERPKKLLSTEGSEPEYSEKATTICAWNASGVEECLPTAGREKNAIHFVQTATASPGGNYGFIDTMNEGIVSISEPAGTHAKASFDKSTSELEFEIEVEGKKVPIRRQNVLYGAGGWLSNFNGALKLNSEDAGIGVSAAKLEYESSPGAWSQLWDHEYLEKEKGCKGVQCYKTHTEYATLDPKLPNGEQKIRYRAEEAIPGTQSLETEGTATVKVDTLAPHAITLLGLPSGGELSERNYELTAEATDGEGSTVASSGVKSIALYIDGSQYGSSGGSCTVSLGQCKASMKWTISGAKIGAGHHAIQVLATDNAGNEARLLESLSIRHSTPVPVGPGSVDLQSGGFSLGASDVSLGSGLTVTRNYSSLATNAGDEGPLGPQWSISTGNVQSLTEMVDGGVILTSANGGRAIFAKLASGGYESPVGDSNLAMTVEENSETKAKLAYYLEDLNKHTKTKFTQPGGASGTWMPTVQEGTVATDTVTYAYQAVKQTAEHPLAASSNPYGIVTGPDGNIWVAEEAVLTGKIAKVTPDGVATEYTLPSNHRPYELTVGPEGAIWFSEDKGNYGLGKITTSGKITEYSVTAETAGIVAGPDGNIWFTEPNAHKVGKITPTGTVTTYSVPSTVHPWAITAGPDHNLWFVEGANEGIVDKGPKVGRITTGGTITEFSLPAGYEAQDIASGVDGNLWFTSPEWPEKVKIAKMSTLGSVLAGYALPNGSSLSDIAAGPDGGMWFTNSNSEGKVGKITMSGAITEYVQATGTSPVRIASGPDGQMWFTDYGHAKVGAVPIKGVAIEPTEALAPVPAGVSCSPELKPGCRALKFSYASSTTATGLNQSEWGEYKGHLSLVQLDAYNPASGKMETKTVAQYSYDKLGLLRAEWDPRTGSALKAFYGYDEEGHVTALTPPGQESWAFSYGKASAEGATGQLLAVTRPSASQSRWNGRMPVSFMAPYVTGSAAAGVTMGVAWSLEWEGSPIAYSYQWQDCNSAGEECHAITGAINANYKPVAADVGHTLRVAVSATNGGGTVTAVSSASAEVIQSEYLNGEGIPRGIVAGPDGNMWVADTVGNIEKIAVNGTVTTYADKETNPAPIGIASDEGKLWFTDDYKSKIVAVTTAGVMTAHSLPSESAPWGIAKGPDGNLWFTERKTSKIGKMTTSGVLTEYSLPAGSEPMWIAAGPDGNVWFTDYATSKIGKITTSGVVTEYALPSGSAPDGVTAGPDGNVWFTNHKTSKIGKITTSGVVTEYALPSGSGPEGIVEDSNKNLSFADLSTSKLGSITTSGSISEFSLAAAAYPQYIASGPDGKLWFTEPNDGLVGRLPAGAVAGATQTPSASTVVQYGLPLTKSGRSEPAGRPAMTAATVAKWGQTDVPIEATAILPPDSRQPYPVSSDTRATIYYLDAEGRLVNVARPSALTNGSISTTEYNETNDVVRTLSADNRQTALEAGSKSVEVAKSLSTYYSYREECSKESENKHEVEGLSGARLCDVEGPQHQIKYVAGKEQRESLARLHTKYFYDESAPAGETYNLQTKSVTLAELSNEAKEEVEGRVTTTSYSGQSNLGWKLRAPTSVTVDPEGKKLTTTTLYNASTGQVTETRAPAGGAGGSPHDTKFIYYSAAANTEGYSGCGEHPEWAGLLCETLPAKQPAAGPKLPVVVTTYNMWNEPLAVTETFGSTARTKTMTYDEAGRLASSETTSSADTPLPKVTNEYNATTGILEKQSTTVAGNTQTVSSVANALGQLTEYTDADGNITKYRYGGPESDNTLEEVADGSNGGTGKQTFSYNATTKQLEEMTDSAAGVFKATYDAEGNLVSEVFPNAMCANTQYNSVGEPTRVEYIKTSKCTETGAPVWFSETRTPAVRGETLSRANTLAADTYSYDSVGRLIEGQETPSGEGCTVRLYGYDEESNRTSQTTRVPGVGGKCATEGGTVLEHAYDEGNHLADTGVGYDSFGNVTSLPAGDAEGHELVTSFYLDGAVASQSQNGVTNSYSLDPAGRVRETVSGASATVSHYDGPGQAVSWSGEAGGKSTRNIPGIDGSMTATQANGAEPVLQLHDLQGDVVATASLLTTATKVLSTYNSTEFGVPNAGKEPPKFAWLGAADIASSLPSGVITYGATSYVPQIGRALQSEEVVPPGLPEGSGAGAAYTAQEEPWNMQGAARDGAEAPGLEAARERTAQEGAFSAVDPWKDYEMNRKNAESKAEEYWEWESTAAVLSFYGLPKDFLEFLGEVAGNIVSQFDDAIAWAHDAGEKLMKCAKNQRPAKENICKIHIDEWEVKAEVFGIGDTFTFPNFSVEPRVEECKYAGSLLICGYIVGITDKEL